MIEYDDNRCDAPIEEKSAKPNSHYAVTGLCFYDNSVIKIAKQLEPPVRKELKATSINQANLKTRRLGCGTRMWN